MLKKIIRTIDQIIFNGNVRKTLKNSREEKKIKRIGNGMEYKFTSFYEKNYSCELSILCDKYGSDKGTISQSSSKPYPFIPHNYTDFYSRIFGHCREYIRNVFECGIGTNNINIPSSMGVFGKPGASLRIWRDFFPNAMIYGADIDKNILFEENRIKTFFIDQLKPNIIKNFWNSVDSKEFDFMVDDGLHTFEAGLTLFIHSIDRLSVNGIYVIEDVFQQDILKYKDFFYNKDYVVEYICLSRPSIGLQHNNLVVIRKK